MSLYLFTSHYISVHLCTSLWSFSSSLSRCPQRWTFVFSLISSTACGRGRCCSGSRPRPATARTSCWCRWPSCSSGAGRSTRPCCDAASNWPPPSRRCWPRTRWRCTWLWPGPSTTSSRSPNGACLVFYSFTGFYWVLLDFTGFYWVLLDFTGLYWVLLGCTGFYWVLLVFRIFFLDFAVFY